MYKNKLLYASVIVAGFILVQGVNAQDSTESRLKALEASETGGSGNKETVTVVDFPPRTDMKTFDYAPLPGIKETNISGPQPLKPSLSAKDLPSEQLLGQITPEVFQEMADIERTNVFLKMQMQQEELKKSLENLKATYRQNRLDEIMKREDVIKSRIKWWQEQERERLELESKKAEAEALAQQIADASALREELRRKALEKLEKQEEQSGGVVGENGETPAGSVEKMYQIESIKGTQGNVIAVLKATNRSDILKVKVGTVLPSGHEVTEITPEKVTLFLDGLEYSIPVVIRSQTDSSENE